MTLLMEIAKPMYQVAEKMPAHRLLDAFLKRREHLFMVADEYGQMAGVVSLEDVIETLLGQEIIDESDPVGDMQALANARYRHRLRRRRNQPE